MELPVPQPQRVNFISRKQSYHGNTLGSLSVGHHVGRRALYEKILATNVHHVSQCYPYRGMQLGDTVETYIARLAQELEDEFQRLGPDTVCAFVAETMAGAVSIISLGSSKKLTDTTKPDFGMRTPTSWLSESNEGSLRAARGLVHLRRGHVRHGTHRNASCLGAGRRGA